MRPLAGTGTLVRLILRRDRIRLPVWIVAILALVYASAAGVQGIYDTVAARASYARTVGDSAATIAMSGPPTAVNTIGGITVFETSASAIIAVCLMAIFLVARHTRAEEEVGRTELLRAAVLGRHAPVAAALLVVSSACVVVGAGIWLSFAGLGLPATGSLIFGASIAMVGVVFAAVTAVAVQVTEHVRGAVGIASAVLGAAYILRGAGDVGNGTLSWLSPIGWSQAVRPYADDRWWPLALSVATVALLVAVAVALVARRDVGAGLVPPRLGDANAGRSLSGIVGLAARLQRGTVIGWVVGLLLGGVAFGSVGREVRDLLRDNPDMREMLAAAGDVDIVDAFFGTAVMMLALIASGFTASSVTRLRSEEAAGRVEPLLAAGLPRSRWILGWLLVTGVGTVLVVASGGLGAGLAHAVATGNAAELPRLLGASLAYVPAVLVVGGVAALLVGWLPRAVLAVWAVVAGSVIIGWLGDILNLPGWLVDLSPFARTPQLPAAEVAWTPLVALSAIAALLVVAATAGVRRRDVV